MKECCKTGDEKPVNQVEVWIKRIVYAAIVIIIAGAAIVQIGNN